MNYRTKRGQLIHEMGGQVHRVDDSTYMVLSQTMPDTKYTLARTTGGWDCSCPIPYNTASTPTPWNGASVPRRGRTGP